MVNGPAMGSTGWLACSVIQSRAHFTVSAWDPAALTHWDGELQVGAQISRRVCLRCRDDHWRQKGSCLYLLSYGRTDTAFCLHWALNTLAHLTVSCSHAQTDRAIDSSVATIHFTHYLPNLIQQMFKGFIKCKLLHNHSGGKQLNVLCYFILLLHYSSEEIVYFLLPEFTLVTNYFTDSDYWYKIL